MQLAVILHPLLAGTGVDLHPFQCLISAHQVGSETGVCRKEEEGISDIDHSDQLTTLFQDTMFL